MGPGRRARWALALCLLGTAIPWTAAQGDQGGPLTVVSTQTTPGVIEIQVPPPNGTLASVQAVGAPGPSGNISMNGTGAVNMTAVAGAASVDSDLDQEIMSNEMAGGRAAAAPGAQPSDQANATAPAPAATSPQAAPAPAPALSISPRSTGPTASSPALTPAAQSPALTPSGQSPALTPAALSPGLAPAAQPPGPALSPGAGAPEAPALAPGVAPGPAPALPPGALLVAPGPLSQMQVEAAETTLEVQMAIDSGNATEAADVLIETESVVGVADALRIAPDAEELPTDVPLQEEDPDVVACKGVAIAVLRAVDSDPAIITRLADAIVASVLPKPAPRFCTTGAPNNPDWWYVHVGGRRRDWVKGSDARCLGTITKNPVGWGQEPCVSGSTKQECEQALAEALEICEPIVEAIVTLGVNDDPQFCRIIDNPYKLVNKTNLVEKLSDRELMMRVQELDPSQFQAQQGRKLMLAGAVRSLLVSNGRNVDSLYCARCWPKDVCEDAFAFCRPKPKKQKCAKGKKGKACRKNKKGKKNKKNVKNGGSGN